jgi:hypothetical protein
MVSFYQSVTKSLPTVLCYNHPLMKLSTRNISWGERWPVREANNLTNFTSGCHEIWEPKALGTLWATSGILPLAYNFASDIYLMMIDLDSRNMLQCLTKTNIPDQYGCVCL